MKCITGAKYTMTATLMHVDDNFVDSTTPADVGSWVESQDPLTGEIVNKWVPGRHEDVLTTTVDETVVGDFPCVARGFSTTARYTSTESFGDKYVNMDMVRMWVPASVRIKKSDRITNIRRNGVTLWLDDDGNPVTFNINGITPQFGPFNQQVETFLMLERTEV